jgi:hypothetical protein
VHGKRALALAVDGLYDVGVGGDLHGAATLDGLC